MPRCETLSVHGGLDPRPSCHSVSSLCSTGPTDSTLDKYRHSKAAYRCSSGRCLSVSSSYTHIDCHYHPERSNINRQLTGKCSGDRTQPAHSLYIYRSNEKFGGAEGKCQSEAGGFHLQKCTKRSSDSSPSHCSRCDVAFKAKGEGGR